MANMILERANFLDALKKWLDSVGIGEQDMVEVYFLPDEIVIRLQPAERESLRTWLEMAASRHGSVLKRLAES